MQFLDRFETVNGYPAVYDPVTDAVVVADLHLGLESLMADSGVYMPKVQLEEAKDDLSTLVEETGATRVIVLGDIKHEFSETSYGEREEVQDLLDMLADTVEDVLLVKGNHDNYLVYAVEDYENVELSEYFLRDGALFVHGHEDVDNLETQEADCVVMGHEHPALTLRDEIGVAEKLPAFLYGELRDGRDLLVLPAFSALAEGSQVNRVDEDELLSPVLREKTDIGTLKAVGVDKEAGLFEFPELEKLR
ncbi:MAG: metallophosphoesterase [Candidatus Nanohaloarchaea archaeon]|nr:metallophosphoesterase [Candidatus Nanohaloarchaea archaeon]